MTVSRSLRSLCALCAASILVLSACDDGSGSGSGDDTGPGGDTTNGDAVLDTTGGDTSGGDTSGGDGGADTGDGSGDVSGDGGDGTNCAVDRVCGGSCCESGTYCINGACRDTCTTGITCGPTGGLCCGSTQACLPDGTCGLACDGGAVACGAVCCAPGEVCGANGQCALDCGGGEACDGVCCGTDQMCLQDQCVAQCANPAKLCGAQSELCCGDAEVCLGGTSCVEPGESCTLTEQCELDEYCEPTLGACVPRSAVEVCEYVPPIGQFAPVPGCTWRPPVDATRPNANSTYPALTNYGDVVMTPLVVNVTDDNGDGATDTLDTPDIIFTSFSYADHNCCTPYGIIRIVSGACNADGTMNTVHTFHDIWVDNSGGLAVANLHPASNAAERAPEIVATSRNNGTFALRRTADDGTAWEVMWHNAGGTRAQAGSGNTPSIADLNGDGLPEVVVGNVVLNGQDGTLLMNGDTLVDPATGQTGTGGVGNNAFLGPSSAVADIDLDGIQEILAGNSIYEWDGTNARIECSHTYATSNSGCHNGAGWCDGFDAVGNFDSDPEGELVIVREGQVFVLDHDCTVQHIVDVPYDDVVPYVGNGPCVRNESGPPTVADFDGDGRPEIGTAGADFYAVIDLDCTGDPLPAGCYREKILWATPNQDCSSRATASSVFDFEGDGRAEVVYADEQNFRVFDGLTGAVLFDDDAHASNTRIEMPVVVDVDNDGKSEIVVAKATNSATDEGITVWQDADNNWVRTRRIWNQHGYHVTNVTEDGQIPTPEEINWLNTRLNNFRQNVQPGGLFDAPDLQVDGFATDYAACNANTVGIVVTVSNRGALGVPAGILVHAVLTTDDGQSYDLGAQPTTQPLLPGQSTDVAFAWTQPMAGTAYTFTVDVTVDDDGMGNGQYNECDEANNAELSGTLQGCPVQ